MDYRLYQIQSFIQKMALTPKMRQSIQILGMPAKDLAEYIDSVLSANPFLQKIANAKIEDRHRPTSQSTIATTTIETSETAPDPRLALLSQVRMAGLKNKEADIAEYLIYELDDNGYIAIESEEAARDLGVTAEEVESVVTLIQKMDPPGIGARDIAECLQIQLERMGKIESLEYNIAASFLAEVARGDIEKIAASLKTDQKSVINAIEQLKKLNPRPATGLLSRGSEKVVPELVATVNAKKVRLELNRGSLPQLRIYNPYQNDLDIIKDDEARKFLKENMEFAKGLIDNIKRREDTLCKVASYILDYQKESITKDTHELKTLTISDVAKALGFHQSTISRVVSNKYIQVNDRSVAMKEFLSHGMKKSNGEITSKTEVKKKIAAHIKDELGNPLTDGEIVKKLESDGIFIKRRTVAKYRNAIRILPKHLRKKS